MGNEFDVRFAAYERAMHAHNNFGLSGDALAQQYGRYTTGLQYDADKAAKKVFGREYGRALAQERAAMRNTETLHSALNGKGVTPANFTTTYGNLEALRAQAPLGNIAPDASKKVTYTKIKEGANKGKWGVYVDGKLESVHDTKTKANEAFNAKRAELGQTVPKPEAPKPEAPKAEAPKAEAPKPEAPKPETPKAETPKVKAPKAEAPKARTGFDEYVLPEEKAATQAQKGTGKAVEQAVAQEAKGTGKAAEQAVAQEAKGASKLGKFFKGKGGKVALALGAAALIGGAIFGLSKCSDNKKAEEVKPEEPTSPVAVPATDETQTEETPAPVAEQPVEEQPKVEEPVNTKVEAVKGDDYWKYAQMELIAEHQGEVGYRPSNEEINTRMFEIMGRESEQDKVGKKTIAEDGIHSDPMLMIKDAVLLNEQTAKLRNEAIKQLKEEHKDQKDYQPTYREVKKRFEELVAAQAEKPAA